MTTDIEKIQKSWAELQRLVADRELEVQLAKIREAFDEFEECPCGGPHGP